MKILICFNLLFVTSIVFCQNNIDDNVSDSVELKIHTSINNLFTAMRNTDSTLLKSVLHEDIVLMTTYKDKLGNEHLEKESLDDFIAAVGNPHPYVYNEEISQVIIQYDDVLAHAWMNYEFYIDETFSHCGVNAMTLIKDDDHWKILYIIDTRRKSGCN